MCRYVQAGTVMNNYAHIFDLLTRLRQVKDHLIIISATVFDTLIDINRVGWRGCGSSQHQLGGSNWKT